MPSVFPANIKAESVKQILDALLFWNLKCSSIFYSVVESPGFHAFAF